MTPAGRLARRFPRPAPGRLAVAACLLLGACATRSLPPSSQADRAGAAFEQPFRDLSLLQEVAPEALTRAAAAPYRPVGDCAGLREEIAKLDEVLGPDVDQPHPAAGSTLVADLIGGAIGLPFRGVVRQLSGAAARDRALRAGVLAGMARRGFLKGAASRMGCAKP